jgi:TPP-dependent pyruvate/acetoin dehydrogenase alpha subunit
MEKMHSDASSRIDAAAEFALSSPDPDPATVLENVYCEN